ncbi:F0F1 ATP synthase, alpha subunit [Mycoplasmoides gallisepticum]|uniref:F0F1 ATP synthase, alpha subunit n=1 Tax=Mycoplasmoides gallisepticum TaxID=2096 RepID=A0A3B0PYN7_MYCGL|nr:F0F1 ATP synthase, alpha subunit [Mycoplasmoides gallisepticum]
MYKKIEEKKAFDDEIEKELTAFFKDVVKKYTSTLVDYNGSLYGDLKELE